MQTEADAGKGRNDSCSNRVQVTVRDKDNDSLYLGRYLICLCTDDEYENIITVFDNTEQMMNYYGINTSTMRTKIHFALHRGKKTFLSARFGEIACRIRLADVFEEDIEKRITFKRFKAKWLEDYEGKKVVLHSPFRIYGNAGTQYRLRECLLSEYDDCIVVKVRVHTKIHIWVERKEDIE